MSKARENERIIKNLWSEFLKENLDTFIQQRIKSEAFEKQNEDLFPKSEIENFFEGFLTHFTRKLKPENHELYGVYSNANLSPELASTFKDEICSNIRTALAKVIYPIGLDTKVQLMTKKAIGSFSPNAISYLQSLYKHSNNSKTLLENLSRPQIILANCPPKAITDILNINTTTLTNKEAQQSTRISSEYSKSMHARAFPNEKIEAEIAAYIKSVKQVFPEPQISNQTKASLRNSAETSISNNNDSLFSTSPTNPPLSTINLTNPPRWSQKPTEPFSLDKRECYEQTTTRLSLIKDPLKEGEILNSANNIASQISRYFKYNPVYTSSMRDYIINFMLNNNQQSLPKNLNITTQDITEIKKIDSAPIIWQQIIGNILKNVPIESCLYETTSKQNDPVFKWHHNRLSLDGSDKRSNSPIIPGMNPKAMVSRQDINSATKDMRPKSLGVISTNSLDYTAPRIASTICYLYLNKGNIDLASEIANSIVECCKKNPELDNFLLDSSEKEYSNNSKKELGNIAYGIFERLRKPISKNNLETDITNALEELYKQASKKEQTETTNKATWTSARPTRSNTSVALVPLKTKQLPKDSPPPTGESVENTTSNSKEVPEGKLEHKQ